MRSEIKTRLAIDDDSPSLVELAKAAGYFDDEWMDWSKVFPYWIVAEREGEILGAIQFFLSMPTCHMDHLLIAAGLSHAYVAFS